MILLWLIALPIAGGLLAWALARAGNTAARVVSLVVLAAEFALSLLLWSLYGDVLRFAAGGPWYARVDLPWIPSLGISLSVGADGISVLMVVLTAFLGLVSVVVSWDEIHERVGFYYFNLLWIIGGIMGVFLALDLFMFYFFWEMMIIPMYVLIAMWGHERRVYAATKFFIFTQASGLLMLVSILGLYFVHHGTSGTYSFLYNDLLGTPIAAPVARWLMLGFLVAFAVKLPAFPFHPWLPDAHTEAPTAGSVILAGLMLKTGAYGMIRFVVPLFPSAALDIAPVARVLGVIGIIYGAILAFGQTDLKRLVAYTSVSHLGFVILGIFAWNELALQGSVIEMVCHGLSTGALFIIVGYLQHQIHTRDMEKMGGLWDVAPAMGAMAMFFAMASLGLPGLGNFVGEFLILLGTYRIAPVAAGFAAAGLVAATIYSLWIVQRAFQGEQRVKWTLHDLSPAHFSVLLAMVLLLVWIGVNPNPLLETSRASVLNMQQSAGGPFQASVLSSPPPSSPGRHSQFSISNSQFSIGLLPFGGRVSACPPPPWRDPTRGPAFQGPPGLPAGVVAFRASMDYPVLNSGFGIQNSEFAFFAGAAP